MHRTESPGNQAGLYTEGDPGGGIPPTVVGAPSMNAIQEELAYLIEGIADIPLKTEATETRKQVAEAILKIIATKASNAHNERIVRNSLTEFQAEAVEPGIRDFIDIGAKRTPLVPPLVCIVSGVGVVTLIDANGADSLGTPAGNTLYYAYISNEDASYAPEELRLSATPPINGLLGAVGNTLNWRYIGAVYLDASIQILNDYALCGFGIEAFIVPAPVTVTRSSGGTGDYTIYTIPQVVQLQKTFALHIVQCHAHRTVGTGITSIGWEINNSGSKINDLTEDVYRGSMTSNLLRTPTGSAQTERVESLYNYSGQTVQYNSIKQWLIRVTL